MQQGMKASPKEERFSHGNSNSEKRSRLDIRSKEPSQNPLSLEKEGIRDSIPARKYKYRSDFYCHYSELNIGTLFHSDVHALRKYGKKLQRLPKDPPKLFRSLREIHTSKRFRRTWSTHFIRKADWRGYDHSSTQNISSRRKMWVCNGERIRRHKSWKLKPGKFKWETNLP